MNGQQPFRTDVSAAIERLARWWTSAAQDERFALAQRVYNGDPQAPPLKAFQIAIYLAEAANGEVTEG